MVRGGIVTSGSDFEKIQELLEEINEILAAKAQNQVNLIAVTKGFTHEEVNVATELGLKTWRKLCSGTSCEKPIGRR